MIRRLLLALAIVMIGALALPPLWYTAFPEPAPELPPPGRRVEVTPGVGVNVIEEGEGPPIVLVHGHPGCAYEWRRLMGELTARGFRSLAYDRVGYGRSDGRTNGAFTVDANAGELLGFLAAEELRDATVVGLSYGGATTIVAARRDASRMARLVLVGSVGPGIENRPAPPAFVVEFIMDYVFVPGLSWLSRVPPLNRRFLRALSSIGFDPDPIPDGFLPLFQANLASPHTLNTLSSEGRDLGGQADLDPSSIDLPMLIVQGEADRLVPLAVGEELARLGKRTTLWVVPAGSHGLPGTHTIPLADRIAAFARAN